MKIRAATLNVWGLPEPFGERVPERMRALGAHMSDLDLDLFALQEVWTAEARATLVAAGRRAGLAHAWHNGPTLSGSGLLVLSRRPIEAVHFERFTLPGIPSRPDHPDYYARKGFARVRIETGAGALSLIDTHLHARYTSDVPHEYKACRVGEIVQIAVASRDVRDALVVTGDFNLEEGTSEYDIVTGLLGVRDTAVELDHREPTIYRGNAFHMKRHKPGRRIDYVFLRNGETHALRPRRIDRIFDHIFLVDGEPTSYSDHAGLLVELDLARSPRAALPPVDPQAAATAARWLTEGRLAAEREREHNRIAAGIGLGAAALATAGVRIPRVTRRRLLRGLLQGAGIAALTPAVGYSILSELYAPSEVRAYESLAARLDRVRRHDAALPA